MSETETTAKPQDRPDLETDSTTGTMSDRVSPVADPEPSAREETTRGGSGGSFLSVLLGGVLAGAIGYLAAYYTEFGLFQSGDEDEAAQISTMIEEQIARLNDVESRLEGVGDSSAVDAVQSEVLNVNEQLTGLAARLEGIEGASGPDLTPVDERLTALEGQIGELSRQVGNPETTETDATQSQQLADLTAELDALTARIEEQSAALDEQTAAIEEARGAAESETSRIASQSALASIRAALESGESYADAVGALESASDMTVPEAISGPAGSGVATFGALRDSFPEASRAALSASVAETAGDGVTNRLGAFLRSATNARSLGEREGSDADAILSRAEARLVDGDLQATLDELEALPEQGRTAMSDWIDRAQTRADAKSALSDLTAS